MSVDAEREWPLLDAAMEVRRAMLGSEYVDAAIAPVTVAFQPFMSSCCWGEIWTDETLSRRDRSLLVLAMTAALGRSAELEIHTRGALNNGVNPGGADRHRRVDAPGG